MLLGVAINGAGHHLAAWRHAGAESARLFTADYATGLTRIAEAAILDFVTFDDALDVRGDDVRGRLDAVLVAARVAPATRHIGLIATIALTHTEPFHASKNIATLDWVSGGRGGWEAVVAGTEAEAANFGRKAAAPPAELYDEAAEFLDVVRRLWDSWEDDAIIRDQPTGRYVDRDRLHFVDFKGRFFSVRGPSITPRSPQGHPVVAMAAAGGEALAVAAAHADIVFVDGATPDEARALRAEIRKRAQAAGRDPEELRILARIDVFLGTDAATADAELAALDAMLPDGLGAWGTHSEGGAPAPDAHGGARPGPLVFVGSPAGLADLLDAWNDADAIDGFLIRPAVLPIGLRQLADEAVPILRARGLVRDAYTHTTLRDRLDLPRPPNRYASPGTARPAHHHQDSRS